MKPGTRTDGQPVAGLWSSHQPTSWLSRLKPQYRRQAAQCPAILRGGAAQGSSGVPCTGHRPSLTAAISCWYSWRHFSVSPAATPGTLTRATSPGC
jgi:hypothetical protein